MSGSSSDFTSESTARRRHDGSVSKSFRISSMTEEHSAGFLLLALSASTEYMNPSSPLHGAFGFARGVGLTGGASALLLALHASSESLSSSGKAQQQACEALRPTGAVAVALTHALD